MAIINTTRGRITAEFNAIALDVNRTYYTDRFGDEHYLARNALADWLEEAGAVSFSTGYAASYALVALRTGPSRLAWSPKNQSVQITLPAHPKKTGRKNTVRYKVYLP